MANCQAAAGLLTALVGVALVGLGVWMKMNQLDEGSFKKLGELCNLTGVQHDVKVEKHCVDLSEQESHHVHDGMGGSTHVTESCDYLCKDKYVYTFTSGE